MFCWVKSEQKHWAGRDTRPSVLQQHPSVRPSAAYYSPWQSSSFMFSPHTSFPFHFPVPSWPLHLLLPSTLISFCCSIFSGFYLISCPVLSPLALCSTIVLLFSFCSPLVCGNSRCQLPAPMIPTYFLSACCRNPGAVTQHSFCKAPLSNLMEPVLPSFCLLSSHLFVIEPFYYILTTVLTWCILCSGRDNESSQVHFIFVSIPWDKFLFYSLFPFHFHLHHMQSHCSRLCISGFVYVSMVAWCFARTMVMLFHPSVSFPSWLME